jgi:hypothetical protein
MEQFAHERTHATIIQFGLEIKKKIIIARLSTARKAFTPANFLSPGETGEREIFLSTRTELIFI